MLAAVVREPRPEDLSLYQLAAHRLMSSDGDAGIRLVLNHVPRRTPGLWRLPEAIALDLAVAHGKRSTLAVLEQIARRQPDLRPGVAAATAALRKKLD